MILVREDDALVIGGEPPVVVCDKPDVQPGWYDDDLVSIDPPPIETLQRHAGGPGSGNFGHAGCPGQVGGSCGTGGSEKDSEGGTKDPSAEEQLSAGDFKLTLPNEEKRHEVIEPEPEEQAGEE